MNFRHKNVIAYIFHRPRLGIPFGIWLIISVLYFWWLICRINKLENQNKEIKLELKNSHKLQSLQFSSTTDQVNLLCKTVHIAMVCMNKCTRQITPMLKSLFYHRQNPVHLHFIVDNVSEKILNELFYTWNLPDVNYTCYNAQYNMWRVEWIPNNHYSGVYAMLKLILPDILNKDLNQVIVLDSDLTFLSDINEIWLLFKSMTENQFIGLVENESNWYLDSDKRWPAIGRGFNTGVMLLNLFKMREYSVWTDMWKEALRKNIPKLKHTMLADQDVINAIIKDNPNIILNISCQYNVQMSTLSLAKECYGEDLSLVKVIHWNSPTKQNVKLKDAIYFRNIYQSFVDMDGNLLQSKLHTCNSVNVSTTNIVQSDLCTNFRTAQHMKLRTHLYYMDYSYDSSDRFDVTLVLQLSMDRLQFLDRLVYFWDGPLSAAIYLSDCDLTEFESFISDWSETLSSRKNIGYHLVFKHDSVPYPVNYLRNVALENVNTPYVFLMDVDFVPMTDLYGHLRSAIQLINPYPQRKCLVVAAFETQSYRVTPPRDKKALVSRLSRDVALFRAREWPRGHRATNYSKWINATAPYEVDWEPDYEPYLVVHRSVPKYDTRFSGFGWNKVSHSVELRARGYRAVVLPRAFVMHTPHAPSLDITKFRANTHYRICLALLKKEFIEDLQKKYNITLSNESQDTPVGGQANSLTDYEKLEPTI